MSVTRNHGDTTYGTEQRKERTRCAQKLRDGIQPSVWYQYLCLLAVEQCHRRGALDRCQASWPGVPLLIPPTDMDDIREPGFTQILTGSIYGFTVTQLAANNDVSMAATMESKATTDILELTWTMRRRRRMTFSHRLHRHRYRDSLYSHLFATKRSEIEPKAHDTWFKGLKKLFRKRTGGDMTEKKMKYYVNVTHSTPF